MNASNRSTEAVQRAKTTTTSSRTPPESPPISLSEIPATPLPVSPPATIFLDPSPQPISRRVRRLIGIVRLRHQGRLLQSAHNLWNSWICTRLPPEEYQAFQDALEKDKRLGAWAADKLRYDYDSIKGAFVLRMPSPLHDIFAVRLQEVITRELKALQGDDVQFIIDNITVAATSDVRFGTASTRDKRSPDGSFRFSGSKYPPVVIEVANAQKRGDLPFLAESYVECTRGRIKTVITIDLEYRSPQERPPNAPSKKTLPPREAVYSIYRHRVTLDEQTREHRREAHEDVEDRHFRMHDSIPMGSMRLLLSDFCPDGKLIDMADRVINITHEELAGLLAEAEAEELVAEAPSSPEDNIPFVSKRKRLPTPRLTSEDEAIFANAEEAAEARNLVENSSFSSADALDFVTERAKRIKTRSQPDFEGSS